MCQCHYHHPPPGPAGHLCKTVQCQQVSSCHCQLMSTSIKLVGTVGCLFKVSKSHLLEWVFKENVSSAQVGNLWCTWCRSDRISALHKLSEAEQLLGLFQCNLLFALYQASSFNSQCKLNSAVKVTADLSLPHKLPGTSLTLAEVPLF